MAAAAASHREAAPCAGWSTRQAQPPPVSPLPKPLPPPEPPETEPLLPATLPPLLVELPPWPPLVPPPPPTPLDPALPLEPVPPLELALPDELPVPPGAASQGATQCMVDVSQPHSAGQVVPQGPAATFA
jgi:hypothetical protein